ncbi:MAG TPA: HAD family hydrolase [Methylomirabilota bacterium]|nr:HAD family hydrolase [Methylomirabilota bacterium]
MRLGVHAHGIAPGSRMERAVLGLAGRGHVVVRAGPLPGRSALAGFAPAAVGEEVDVLLGGSRALAATWWAARLRAQALVLALEPGAHARWGALDRWAWSLMAGHGLIDEDAAGEFMARTTEAEQERLVLWPAGGDAAADVAPSTLAATGVLERACERALARRSAGPWRAALFVDRDGTLILEREYISQPDDVELLPGVATALRQVRNAGHPVVVISNQAGVGRGYFDEARVHDVMARMRALLRTAGVELDAIRFCPHAPDAGCDCRKPGGRLLREAADDLRLSLRDSAMVGDRWLDVDAGLGVGAAGVLVRTGYGAAEAANGREGPPATAVVDDLGAAVRWFLERAG